MSAISIFWSQGLGDSVTSILVLILVIHAIGWMQTGSYKRQKLIGQYRVYMGRFHGYSISIVCILLLQQMYYLEKGQLLHKINGYLIFISSFLSIWTVIISNVLDIFVDNHLPMIWKLVSPIGDYLFAFYYLFCAFKSFQSVQSHDISGHIFWAKRFGNSALITLSTFPLFKRSSKIIFGSQIYGGTMAGFVSAILFIFDYYYGYSNTFVCANK